MDPSRRSGRPASKPPRRHRLLPHALRGRAHGSRAMARSRRDTDRGRAPVEPGSTVRVARRRAHSSGRPSGQAGAPRGGRAASRRHRRQHQSRCRAPAGGRPPRPRRDSTRPRPAGARAQPDRHDEQRGRAAADPPGRRSPFVGLDRGREARGRSTQRVRERASKRLPRRGSCACAGSRLPRHRHR